MSEQRVNLNTAASVTLSASGAGTVELGPAPRGKANWHVTGVIIQTNRPGQAPIPRVVVYLDSQDVGGTQGLSYDGSFAQGRCDLTIARGQKLIAAWTGGQSGDRASITVTGEQW